jgi:hypothetical protein
MCFEKDLELTKCMTCLTIVDEQLLSFKITSINNLVKKVINNNYDYQRKVNPLITNILSKSNKFRYVGCFDVENNTYSKVKELEYINIKNIKYMSHCLCYHPLKNNHYIIDENDKIYVIGSTCIGKFIICIKCNKYKTNKSLLCVDCKKEKTILLQYKTITDRVKDGRNRAINKYIKKIKTSQFSIIKKENDIKEMKLTLTYNKGRFNFGKYIMRYWNDIIEDDIFYIVWIYSLYISNKSNKNMDHLINYIQTDLKDKEYIERILIEECFNRYGLIEPGYDNRICL